MAKLILHFPFFVSLIVKLTFTLTASVHGWPQNQATRASQDANSSGTAQVLPSTLPVQPEVAGVSLIGLNITR